MKDVVQTTVIEQYIGSPVLTGIIESLNEAASAHADLDMFYSYVWDIATAQGFGLDIWGRIVGLPYGRLVTIPPNDQYLGFQDGTNDWQPFNQAPMYTAGSPLGSTGAVTLLDDAFRTLILVKALANISDCSIPDINRLLTLLFEGRGRAYCLDDGHMEMTYVFEFALMPYELGILTSSGALLHPTGVGVNINVVPFGAFFAFQEQGTLNVFGEGVFY